ncbi:hypothetical protein EVAR_16286_1 [Eumeta japonica]|uniref:Uncharacterized protein n=1 Tax=Eumeta variegata TaxID=151549 RepID=A0A4C2A199_EUMVA|nr:hypothetical protein EVAR_16286_1 [Eumeta japonica]
MKLFLARHPNLSSRQPESLSRARIQGFTAENVKSFFDILKPELKKIKFNPNKILNVDETGITTVQHKGFSSSRPRTPTESPRLSNSSSPFIVPADIRPIPVVEPPSKSTRRDRFRHRPVPSRAMHGALVIVGENILPVPIRSAHVRPRCQTDARRQQNGDDTGYNRV